MGRLPQCSPPSVGLKLRRVKPPLERFARRPSGRPQDNADTGDRVDALSILLMNRPGNAGGSLV